MMTPQVKNNGIAIAELNSIPTYPDGFSINKPHNTRIEEVERAYLDRWGKRTNKLSKRHTKELRKYDREQLESGPVESNRSSSKPDRINHQNPVDNGADDRVGDLRQELRDGEHFGGVQSAVGFPDERT